MIELSTDKQRDGLAALARALAAESDGKALKRELAKQLRTIMEPMRAQQVSRLMSIPSKGHSGPGLRQAAAKQTKAGVRFSGKNVGVNLVQRARGMPRGFTYAGRALNREEGWNPKTLGGTIIHQHAHPVEWFDQPTHGAQRDAKVAVLEAMERMAARIAARAGR